MELVNLNMMKTRLVRVSKRLFTLTQTSTTLNSRKNTICFFRHLTTLILLC